MRPFVFCPCCFFWRLPEPSPVPGLQWALLACTLWSWPLEKEPFVSFIFGHTHIRLLGGPLRGPERFLVKGTPLTRDLQASSLGKAGGFCLTG